MHIYGGGESGASSPTPHALATMPMWEVPEWKIGRYMRVTPRENSSPCIVRDEFAMHMLVVCAQAPNPGGCGLGLGGSVLRVHGMLLVVRYRHGACSSKDVLLRCALLTFTCFRVVGRRGLDSQITQSSEHRGHRQG